MIDQLLKRLYFFNIDAYFLFRKDISIPSGAEITDDSYSTREITSIEDPDFERLCVLWNEAYHENDQVASNTGRKELTELLMNGDVCCCLMYGQEPVGMGWLSMLNSQKLPDFSTCLKGMTDAGLNHHDYITKRHRGKGLLSRIHYQQEKTLRQREKKQYYTFVGVNNFASVRQHFKTQDEYKLIYHVKIDIPFFSFNLYPSYRSSGWKSCDA